MIVVVRGRCGLNTPTNSTGAFLVVVECLLLATVLQLNVDVASDLKGTLRAHFTTGFRF